MIVAALLLTLSSVAPATAPRNACQLLTAREVRRVQGQPFESTKLIESRERGLDVSQCVYALPSFGKSVSVDVLRGKTLEFWREKLGRASDARPIDGIGDAAIWSGSRLAGALYVLQGETVLRVSVGGPGTADEKIARSKKLAARALGRL